MTWTILTAALAIAAGYGLGRLEARFERRSRARLAAAKKRLREHLTPVEAGAYRTATPPPPPEPRARPPRTAPSPKMFMPPMGPMPPMVPIPPMPPVTPICVLTCGQRCPGCDDEDPQA